ncbi:hypothetical protein J8J04_00420 ['Fragaria x ananassa' phyllody phytoplasma]|uniref:Uncharacterized protein n=1 Tax='Fragaria x ananassa' phyllody phytoplasma TaxID=2358428 RepID=A0ABS5K2S6_9MOLU|nr:hypothetical protein ['Fragaria x ananassa' phyllody phytoplasma]MBS2126186.1 hypothetical protein ['Fragaria x ananassa' phyllody phytoplasma]
MISNLKQINNDIKDQNARFANEDFCEQLRKKIDKIEILLAKTCNLNDIMLKIDELNVEYNTFTSENPLNTTNPSSLSSISSISSPTQTNLILFSWIFGILYVLILLILLIIFFSKHTRKYTRKR